MNLKKLIASLVAIGSLLAIWTTATAAPYKLVAWHQRSSSGTLSSLHFKSGAAQGCPGPTYTQPCYSTTASPGGLWVTSNGVDTAVQGAGQPTFDWNGSTMTMTGLLWAASSIASNPNGSIVISDRITNFVVNTGATTTTASTYECREGTFLTTVNANGCLNTDEGTNGSNESSAAYNVSSQANCIVRTIGGDDFSTGNPRGVQDAVAGGGCDAVDGGFNLWTIVPNPRFVILSNQATITNDGCYMFGRQSTATSSPCASDAGVAGASYMIFAADIDTDGDGILDALDNCRTHSNASQVDSDGDGIGNRCDGDFNNNGVSNSQDYVLFRQQLGQPSVPPTYNSRDINANGVVNSQDYVLFRGLLGLPVNTQSGLCNGIFPCPANP